MKKTLPLILSFVAGMIMLLDSYFKIDFINSIAQRYLMRSVTVSVAWSMGIGALNLIRLHFRHITMRRENWQYSILLVVVFFFMGFCGLTFAGYTQNPFYNFFYSSLQQNLSATVYALNAFYMVSACYRSFRARSSEATILLLTATLVMIGSVPIGAYIWEGFPAIQNWIMKTINDPAVRAMGIGVTLGSLSQSMRSLVGIERGHLSGGEG